MAKTMEAERHKRVAWQAQVTRRLSQKRWRRVWSPCNQTMKMLRSQRSRSTKHGPVTHGPPPGAHTDHQGDGHTGGEQLQQAEEVAHDGQRAEDNRVEVMMVVQVYVLDTAVVFAEDPPVKTPALESDSWKRLGGL